LARKNGSPIEESLLDRDQQVVGQDAKEDVRLDALLELMEDRPLGKRRLHIAEGVLSAGEQEVDAPKLVA
jgi:hypothetical protein